MKNVKNNLLLSDSLKNSVCVEAWFVTIGRLHMTSHIWHEKKVADQKV